MDSLYVLGLELIIWLQESFPQLEGFFKLSLQHWAMRNFTSLYFP